MRSACSPKALSPAEIVTSFIFLLVYFFRNGLPSRLVPIFRKIPAHGLDVFNDVCQISLKCCSLSRHPSHRSPRASLSPAKWSAWRLIAASSFACSATRFSASASSDNVSFLQYGPRSVQATQQIGESLQKRNIARSRSSERWKICKFDGLRRMLKNAQLLASFGVDTADEASKHRASVSLF